MYRPSSKVLFSWYVSVYSFPWKCLCFGCFMSPRRIVFNQSPLYLLYRLAHTHTPTQPGCRTARGVIGQSNCCPTALCHVKNYATSCNFKSLSNIPYGCRGAATQLIILLFFRAIPQIEHVSSFFISPYRDAFPVPNSNHPFFNWRWWIFHAFSIAGTLPTKVKGRPNRPVSCVQRFGVKRIQLWTTNQSL